MIENFDLYAEAHTPNTAFEVTSTKVKNAPTPAPEKPKARKNDAPGAVLNIQLFAAQRRRSMLTAFKHSRDCIKQVTKFA